MFIFVMHCGTAPSPSCTSTPPHYSTANPPPNDAHALPRLRSPLLLLHQTFATHLFDPLQTSQQAIADVAHSQLAMYSMQHEQRPNVEVAATLLEGLCYSNK